jgi:tetratricopeptide (TPR) repeat protein
MFENVINKFRWGNMNDPKVYLDETNQRMTYNFRNNFVRLASKLIQDGDKEKARLVLDKAEELMPDSRVPYNYFNLLMADLYRKIGEKDKALAILDRLKVRMEEDINYFNQFTGGLARSVQEDRRRAEYILQACNELISALRLNVPVSEDEADTSQ